MSSFDYNTCYLTYFISVATSLFDDDIRQVIGRAISPISTRYKLTITSVITELCESSNGTQNVSLAFKGFYCIIIFENDEERSMFKLAIPTDEELEKRIIDVLHQIN